MIITKDNLLRFVREQKYVTPTNISEKFETSTMIASAALSELSKEKLISISNIKIGSTPYYYDPRQKSCLIELGKKHLSGYDKEAMQKLQEQQIVNDAGLSIQLRLSMEKIKDFAIPLEITAQGKEIKFWVWYERDINETKNQINDAIKGNSTPEKKTQSTTKKEENKPKPKIQKAVESIPQKKELAFGEDQEEKVKGESFIENYFHNHYLNLESKKKNEKTIKYQAALKVKNMVVMFDCIYFIKKPSESDILKYYTSTSKPKIIFMDNPSKKLQKLSKELDNLEVVSI